MSLLSISSGFASWSLKPAKAIKKVNRFPIKSDEFEKLITPLIMEQPPINAVVVITKFFSSKQK